MKVRRVSRAVDLRDYPLDGYDMYLLTRLDDALSVAELSELAPGDPSETLRRVHSLVQLELVELEHRPANHGGHTSAGEAPARSAHRPQSGYTFGGDGEHTGVRPRSLLELDRELHGSPLAQIARVRLRKA